MTYYIATVTSAGRIYLFERYRKTGTYTKILGDGCGIFGWWNRDELTLIHTFSAKNRGQARKKFKVFEGMMK